MLLVSCALLAAYMLLMRTPTVQTLLNEQQHSTDFDLVSRLAGMQAHVKSGVKA